MAKITDELVAHCAQAIDRPVVVQAVTRVGPGGVDHAIAPFPRPEKLDCYARPGCSFLDGVHRVSNTTRYKGLTSASRGAHTIDKHCTYFEPVSYTHLTLPTNREV